MRRIAVPWVLLAITASSAAELRVTVRGADWLIATGSDKGSCGTPRVDDLPGVVNECWDPDGNRAVVDSIAGCVETSGIGYCGPVAGRPKRPAGAMAMLCPSGDAYLLTSGGTPSRCWTRSADGLPQGQCHASAINANGGSALADCGSGCDRTAEAGGCMLIAKAAEPGGLARLYQNVIPLNPPSPAPSPEPER